ncbi:MAG: hypothetical protein ACRDAM_22385, partial [Casimicrobium sp.]
KAIEAHLRDPKHGEFLPRPASIERWLATFHADDGRPSPDEAWGIALAAESEAATVVWTPEIRAAWAACETIAVEGRDKVGARKTFLATYERVLQQVRARAEPVRWDISHGHDPHQRVAAIEEAARLNRIASADALAVIAMVKPLALPSATAERVAASDGAVAGLLAHVAESSDVDGLARLAETKRVLAERRAARLAEEDAARDELSAAAAKRAAAMVALHGGADAVARATERVMSLNPQRSTRRRAKAAA